MSHKIKIDLCEVFGVKEGEEFKIDESGWKYKIENNNVFSYSCGNWVYSTLPVNVILDYTFKIEILKPETPPEIKKMLQGFYDMGFRVFRKDNNFCVGTRESWLFEESFRIENQPVLYFNHSKFDEWAKNLNPNFPVYLIEDYL